MYIYLIHIQTYNLHIVVKGNIYRNFEIANITVNYYRGLAVVKQNSIHGRVHG